MPSHEIEDDPWLGRELAEQVEVRALIGVGAMGRVYRGHQRGIERPVAVKVLHADLLHRPGVMERFHREARVASRLNHPNVVQVLMTGEVAWQVPSSQGGPSTQQGVGGRDQNAARHRAGDREGDRESPSAQRAAYLVMEYLDGDSLASVLEKHGGPLRLERALHIALQVCDAVGEAHDQGIVHRDLKPENVMLVRRGGDPDFVKVLDFGVAKVDWLDGAQATQVGTVFGTARYMAPEAARGELVTPRSDVYSIATLLYQCLAGRTPFDGTNTVAVLVKQCSELPLELSTITPHVPAALARVVHQNLSKTPAERCATARELGAALLAAAREARIEGFATATRPTLHGTEGPPPTDPFPQGHARPIGTALRQPSETTLIDPELAGTPAGGPLLRTRHESRTSFHEATCLDAPRRDRTEQREPERLEDTPRRRTSYTVVPGSAASGAADAAHPPPRQTLLEEPADHILDTHHGAPPDASPHARRHSSLGTASAVLEPSGPTGLLGTARVVGAPGPAAAPGAASPQGTSPPLHRPSALWASDAPPPSAPRRPRARRTLRWLAVFGVLAGLAAGGAYFSAEMLAARDESLAAYVDRANGALALGAWHSDTGNGFVEITNAGLTRYPEAPELVELQKRGARRMAREARRLQDVERDRALELARLAEELAPSDETVRQLTSPLLTPEAREGGDARDEHADASSTTAAEAARSTPLSTEPNASGDVAASTAGPNSSTAGSAPPLHAGRDNPAAAPAPAKPAASPPTPGPTVARVPGPLPRPAAPRPSPKTSRPAVSSTQGKPKAAPKASTSGSGASKPSSAPPSESEERGGDDGSGPSPEKPRERWL